MPYILGQKKSGPAPLDISSLELKDRPLLIDSSMDDGGWREPRPWNRVFMASLQAIVQLRPELRSRIYVDPTMSAEDQQKHLDVGVFEARFGKWGLVLNWTTRRVQQVIPARHIAVGYLDTPAGIIGPYMDARECWNCAYGGIKINHIGQVLPGQSCPKCRRPDWFGRIVQPAHLQRDAAEAVADSLSSNAKQERLFSHISGDSEQQIRKGAFKYGTETHAAG